MAKVTGIGGIFFKAEDPGKIRDWYERHLGIEISEDSLWLFNWREKDRPQQVGATVWSPFPKTTRYFEPGTADYMVNYRVDNLDEMLEELRRAGVQVEDRIDDNQYGRFGWAFDPEGNKFELWQPSGEEGQEDLE